MAIAHDDDIELSSQSRDTNDRVRMTGHERREQLIEVGRQLFAEKGFEAVSIEEIALNAKVSKPVVYEHFGSKDGLYAVVVDREMNYLLNSITKALTAVHPRVLLEQTAFALFDYIEMHNCLLYTSDAENGTDVCTYLRRHGVTYRSMVAR